MIISRYNDNGITFYYYIGNHNEGEIGSCITTIKNNTVKIENIEINYKYRCKGVGSFIIKYVINYFKFHRKKIIYGIFFPEKGCYNKLFKFYKKN